jgi:uncharacterized membrane protein
MASTPARVPYRHPVNVALEAESETSRGARVADGVTAFLGSWRFIVIQTVVVLIWIVGNVILLFHYDPYPFILLNLAFSTQAAYAAPLILLASNRTAIRDRMTLEHAAEEGDVGDTQNQQLLLGNQQILERVVRLEESILALELQIKAAIERLER